jgi:PEP-CTERM motif-containing protein
MRASIPAIGAFLAVAAFGMQAHATQAVFSFSGGPFSGSGVFTIAPNISPPDPNPLCGTAGANPCRADPAGAYAITGVSGTFSDSNLGISNAAITGLVPINPANERDPTFDPLVPTSLSFVDYSGPPAAGALTYNNLFFPGGSPIDCNYPFSGTFLDVFGAAFTVAGGYTVNLWGDGDEPVIGNTYGVGVTNGVSQLDYQFDGVSGVASVPEPRAWALMLMGFGGLGWSLRRSRARSHALTAAPGL